jgi:hypothetical protein
MAADRKISRVVNNQIEDVDSRDKLEVFEEPRIGVSYWGLATLNGIPMRDHLEKVKTRILEAHRVLNVDSFAQELEEYLHNFYPNHQMGFHIAGYQEGLPRIRHVFHVDWHNRNEFTNENSNMEFHDAQGNRIPHTSQENYIPYLSLFNGDNIVVQGLLLLVPHFKGLNYALDYETLNLEEAINLSKLLISTTIHLQSYLRGYRRVGRTCGNGLDIVTITPTEISWVGRNLETVEFNVT